MGERNRNRLLNVEKLLELLDAASLDGFRVRFVEALKERIEKDDLVRQAKWTECLAVGSEAFVEAIRSRITNRQVLECREDGGSWVLHEEHGSHFGLEM